MVESSRSSASPKRPSWVVLWMLMTPMAWSPAMIGTPSHDLRQRALAALPELVPVGCAVEEHRPPALQDLRGQPLAERQRLLGRVLALLDVVRELDHAELLVDEGDVGDVGVERLARLLADELDERPEVELGG